RRPTEPTEMSSTAVPGSGGVLGGADSAHGAAGWLEDARLPTLHRAGLGARVARGLRAGAASREIPGRARGEHSRGLSVRGARMLGAAPAGADRGAARDRASRARAGVSDRDGGLPD